MSENNSKTGIIAGIAAALAAGAVYFYGPEGKRRRQRLRGWMLKAKGEVLEQIEKAEDLTREQYEDIIDRVTHEIKEKKAVTKPQVEKFAKELKADWERIKLRMEEKGEELREAAAEELSKQADNISQK